MTNMKRLEHVVNELPEAERVDIAEWGDHPTFRVRGKSFVVSDIEAELLSVKLSREEAAAVAATDPTTSPTGYGLGRHGWISLSVTPDADDERWRQVTESVPPPTRSSPPSGSPAACSKQTSAACVGVT